MTGYVGSTHTGTWRENRAVAPLLYLDQNYLSGFAKGKPAFRELEVALRAALERGAVAVVREFPERRGRTSDVADLDAMAIALVHCSLVTCDAFMADVIRRTRLQLRHRVELYSGRRADVLRLRDRLTQL
jgi:hypothetical protein